MARAICFKAHTIIEGFDDQGRSIVHENAALVVRGGRICEIGAVPDSSDVQTVSLPAGSIIVPGLINAHHHVGLTPLRLGSSDHPLELWFASRLALRDVDLYTDTLFSAFEMLRTGITTVQHLHSRVAGGPERLVAAGQEVIRAYCDIGMRASYSLALRDQNRLVYGDDRAFADSVGGDTGAALHRYFDRFTTSLEDQLAAFHSLREYFTDNPLIRFQLAPANLHWLSDEALVRIADEATQHGVPMHMHLLETPYQRVYAQRRTGGSALAHLEKLGFIGPRLTLGHGVWMDEEDVERCATHNVRICHNCSSNVRLKSGRAPLRSLLDAGIHVAIGIDEAGINDDRDMFQEMRLVLNLHRNPGIGTPDITADQVMCMATRDGASTTPFSTEVGSLAPGAFADFFVIDGQAMAYPSQSDAIPLTERIIRRAREKHLRLVCIGGEEVIRDGQFTRVNETAILDEIARRMSLPLSAEEAERITFAAAVFPHVRDFYTDYEPAVRRLLGHPWQ